MTYEAPELLTLGMAADLVLGGDPEPAEDADNDSLPIVEVFALDV